ncbi:MAG TPA: hypothetical protein VG734_13985, partial [Lacunisphaera sp.]|nr:hypothetical protein [Lacunisphaera sp.]
MSHRRPATRSSIPLLLFIAALAFHGCASEDKPRGPGDRAASRKAPAPALAGQQAFFDEKITAEVKVGALTGFDRHSGGTGTG